MERFRDLGIGKTEMIRAVDVATPTAKSSIQDEMRTRVERFLAVGEEQQSTKAQYTCGKGP